jgi:hypothetical protein
MNKNRQALVLVLAGLLPLLAGCGLWQSPQTAAWNYVREKVAEEGHRGTVMRRPDCPHQRMHDTQGRQERLRLCRVHLPPPDWQ